MVGESSRASTGTSRGSIRVGKRKRERRNAENCIPVYITEPPTLSKRQKIESNDGDLNYQSMNRGHTSHQHDEFRSVEQEKVTANGKQHEEEPVPDHDRNEAESHTENRGEVAQGNENDEVINNPGGKDDGKHSSGEEKMSDYLSSDETSANEDLEDSRMSDESVVGEYCHSDFSDVEEYIFADQQELIDGNMNIEPDDAMPELEESDSSDDENQSPTSDLDERTLQKALEASRKNAFELGYDSDAGEYGGPNGFSREISLDNRWNSCFQLMRWNPQTEKSIQAARYIAKRFRAGNMKDEDAERTRPGHIGRFKAKKQGQKLKRPQLLSTCLNSLALLVSGKGITELQYGALYKFISTCIKCIETAVIEELFCSFDAQHEVVKTFIKEKVLGIKAIFAAANPIYSLTHAKRLKTTHLQNLRLKSRTVISSSKKGKVSRTRLIKPSHLLEADLLFDETATPLLERRRCDVKFAPIPFYDCPMAAKPWALTRPVPFGALADTSRLSDISKTATGINRPYTSRLFAQGSKLALHTPANTVRGANERNRKRSTSYVEKSTLLPHIVAIPQGDPFILNEETKSYTSLDNNKVHKFDILSKWATNADTLWPIAIEKEKIVHDTGTANSRNDSEQVADAALDVLIEKSDAYLCHSFVTSDGAPKHKDGRTKFLKYIIFVGNSTDEEEKRNCTGQIEVVSVEILKDPPNWVKGELRPIVGPERANPYRLKRFDKRTGAQIVVIPIVLYTDKFNRGEGRKASMAGFYFIPIGMRSHYRSGAQSVRVASATSDGMDPNTPIFASIQDLQKMENEGKLMQTCHGPKLVYFKVVGFNVDFVQAADSTHSLSHSATCPCTICAVRRGDEGHVRHCEVTGSASLNIFLNQERLTSLKARGLGKLAFVYCGVKEGVNSRPEDFLDGLQNTGEPKDTMRDAKPPYNALLLLSQCSGAQAAFDYSISTLPAPDHCLGLGSTKGVLNMTYCCIKPGRHFILTERLIEAARASGLPTPESVQKTEGSLANGYVAGLSVAHLSSLIVVAPVVLATMQDEFESESTYAAVRDIVTSVSELVALIYFTPRPVCDTEEEAKRRYDDVRQVGDLAAEYLLRIKAISVSSFYSTNVKRAVMKFCDVPNLHRFFEICTFWLPAAGYNIYHLAEIVFEKAHQFIKRYTHFVPANYCAGEYAMVNYLNDLTLRRMALAFGKSRDGPGAEFVWEGSAEEVSLFESLKPFFCPPKRSTADIDDRPASNFITMHGERDWITFQRYEVEGTVDTSRVRQELNLSSSEINGKYTQTRYGQFREPRHYTLRPGQVVSGITLHRIYNEAAESNVQGKIIRLRPGRVSELSLLQTFGEARVTVLVQEIWNVTRNNDRFSSKENQGCRIWVRGNLLIQNTQDHRDLNLPVFDLRQAVWIKLDRSCRRLASFPLVRSKKGSLLPKIMPEKSTTEKTGKYVVLGHQDGYPGRSA